MAHCHLPLMVPLWYHLGSSLVIDSVSDKALERGLLSLHGKKRCRKTNKLLKFSSEGVAKPKQRCLPLGFLQPEMQIFLQGKSCWQFSLCLSQLVAGEGPASLHRTPLAKPAVDEEMMCLSSCVIKFPVQFHLTHSFGRGEECALCGAGKRDWGRF